MKVNKADWISRCFVAKTSARHINFYFLKCPEESQLNWPDRRFKIIINLNPRKREQLLFNPFIAKGSVSLSRVKSSGVSQGKIYKWVSGRKGFREIAF